MKRPNIRQVYLPADSRGPYTDQIRFTPHSGPCRPVGLYLFGIDPETTINGFRFGNAELFASFGKVPAVLFSSENRDPIDLENLVKTNDLRIDRNHELDGFIVQLGNTLTLLIEGEVKHAVVIAETFDDPRLCRRRVVIDELPVADKPLDDTLSLRDIRYRGQAFEETLRGEVCVMEATAGSEEVCASLLQNAFVRSYYR